jgi:protein required for attachment to host cells
MPHYRKLIYLLADGAHARFVERSRETGAFVTVQRLSGTGRLAQVRAEQRDEAPGRSFESATQGSHAVGREDAYRRAKEAFAAHVAAEFNGFLAAEKIEGVVLVAPRRLLAILRGKLSAHTLVVAELPKDLIKTPDHRLAEWLSPMALAQAG